MNESRVFINNSNSKWISFGVRPSTKLLNPDFPGFELAIAIDGVNMIPMLFDGLENFKMLFKTIRQMDEFKYSSVGTASKEYAEFPNGKPPFVITLTRHGYSNCIKIDNNRGQATIAANTVNELLTREQFMLALGHAIENQVTEIEDEFISLVRAAAADYGSTVSSVLKKKDPLQLSIITNFDELFKLCVDIELKKDQTTGFD